MPRETELFENCRIIFRNFQGKEGQYNAEGDRNFCLLLSPEEAEMMDQDGWNVKYLRAREAEETPQAYLPISVGYKNRPPKISMVTSKGRTLLDEEMVGVLDWVDIAKVDMIIRPYQWNVGGRGGVKAYVKTLVVVIEEDYLELKYADLEELPARAGRYMDMVDGEVIDDQLAIEGGR